MRNADKDRDPVKAQKRALSDLRCAAKKLGPEATMAAVRELFPAHWPMDEGVGEGVGEAWILARRHRPRRGSSR